MMRTAAQPAALLQLLLVMAMLVPASSARAQDLIADLSSHLVSITTDFTGAQLLLFGAVEGEGDIVVVVTGPMEEVTVRHKERVAGIWVNADSMTFTGVPNFYAVASSQPLDKIASPEVRRRQQIGAENLDLLPIARDRGAPPERIRAFREALIRAKQQQRLFTSKAGAVTVISKRLFRSQISFPSNLATGPYTAVVYLIRDGEAVHAQTTPLLVEKSGFGAEITRFAHRQSAVYGIVAILVAVAAGWIAAAVFRKV